MSYIERETLVNKLEHEFNDIEYISADDLKTHNTDARSYKQGISTALVIIDELPKIHTTSKNIGYWKDGCPVISDGSRWKSYECSQCDNRVFSKTNYCSDCGADMVTKEEYDYLKGMENKECKE